MVFDVRRDVLAKRIAFESDADILQIPRHFKALKLKGSTCCCSLLQHLEGSGPDRTGLVNSTVKTCGKDGKTRLIVRY